MADVIYALVAFISILTFPWPGFACRIRLDSLVWYLESIFADAERYLYMHSLALMHHTLYPGRTPALIWVHLLLHVDCVQVQASRKKFAKNKYNSIINII